jgi:hypothetical protein
LTPAGNKLEDRARRRTKTGAAVARGSLPDHAGRRRAAAETSHGSRIAGWMRYLLIKVGELWGPNFGRRPT